MNNLDNEQLKDQLEYELDVMQFLDLTGITFRELIDIVFDSGLSAEQLDTLSEAVR
jgi:hypothetical protein